MRLSDPAGPDRFLVSKDSTTSTSTSTSELVYYRSLSLSRKPYFSYYQGTRQTTTTTATRDLIITEK